MLTYGEINKIKNAIAKEYKENTGNYSAYLRTYDEEICDDCQEILF